MPNFNPTLAFKYRIGLLLWQLLKVSMSQNFMKGRKAGGGHRVMVCFVYFSLVTATQRLQFENGLSTKEIVGLGTMRSGGGGRFLSKDVIADLWCIQLNLNESELKERHNWHKSVQVKRSSTKNNRVIRVSMAQSPLKVIYNECRRQFGCKEFPIQ